MDEPDRPPPLQDARDDSPLGRYFDMSWAKARRRDAWGLAAILAVFATLLAIGWLGRM